MKKVLTLVLVLSFVLSQFVIPVHAKVDVVKVKEMSKAEKREILKEKGLSENDIIDLGADYLSKETKNELKEEIAAAKKDGVEFNGVFVYTLNPELNISPSAVEPGPGGGSGVTTYEYYSSFTKEIDHDESSGLKTVVKSAWNILIGSTTKHVWKILEVVSMSENLFYDYYVQGDYAKDIITTWKTYTVYEGIPEWTTSKQDLVKTVAAQVKTRSIVAGTGPNGAIDEDEYRYDYYKSANYYNTTWIYDMIDSVSSGIFPKPAVVDEF